MDSSDWFEHWFNTKYYHLLYEHRNEKEAQFFIDGLCRYLKWPKNSKLIDIACGKGRHAIRLNKLGFDVTGVDLSQNNVKAARKYENDLLRFYVHDMKKVFKPAYFDGVLNLFTSFGYFEHTDDNKLAISSMALNLKKGGYIVIDYLNNKPLLNNLEENRSCTRGSVDFKIEKRIEACYLIKEIVVRDGQKEQQFTERLHLYNLDDFTSFFMHSNLKIKHVFGNYALDNFDEDSSERIILIGERL